MSIKSIAKVAGVSPSTVSRVLNNPGYKCSVPGLRDKIWKIAMEQNYVPNEAARNLKRGISERENKTYYITCKKGHLSKRAVSILDYLGYDVIMLEK